ncbi:MAG: UbiA family prenyltransferase [Candidatus Marinimicrobia bacterium]|jgi:1,4-dihydroxy-2-naphthoate octaprenyltransferase|nr:UbiA family prenyltransferase [Candidatus Neomarinimicrobiota bacterium]MDP6400864.1 UbiA family prenyltransferase [Candidatus Neomarinimicrobiota bacterium]MDP6614945.1 UbiA family prenyltransferase [Candidatus Neomarinimicrobiota bacterium]MDP6821114.1 UbiA family prenyltransferase [Candidatus Neomarinimicrobiota bacterium]MDP7273740.1 UbiA family prenyltransferase [Candidatus Neomarinimicrobiota bacterium]|tara:strand:- start:1463 stop:2971 length:1509 start_codon:yes stop_codon:yes gene_type:complete
MDRELDAKILGMLNEANFLTIGTAVGNNPSAANVYFANEGFDIYFFTFNPTRKAEQIRVNPEVQCVVRPDGSEGIKELQITGFAEKIKDPDEVEKAYTMVCEVTEAFKPYMEDEFLKKNDVVGYYKIKPTVIKYVDFFSEQQFEWREFPENQSGLLTNIIKGGLRKAGLYLRAVRAPFFTATIAPVALGGAVAYFNLKAFDWSLFWWSLLGAVLAHAGTNLANDYSDHKTRNDESNKLFSPFNGGSRTIQAGLFSSTKVFILSVVMFLGAIGIGLKLNTHLHGAPFAISPLLWFGLAGVFLGITYTGAPLRLSYNGFGDFAVMLGFGPVMALGTHYVQYQALQPQMEWYFLPVLAASVPVAILVGLILFINGFQDFNADREVGKRTWIVRTADTGTIADYTKPFAIYKGALYFTFLYVFTLGISGAVYSDFSTPWILIALLPFLLARKAMSMGGEWLERWAEENADRQKLPYELLMVNVSTIGTHFTVGILLTVGYWLGTVY